MKWILWVCGTICKVEDVIMWLWMRPPLFMKKLRMCNRTLDLFFGEDSLSINADALKSTWKLYPTYLKLVWSCPSQNEGNLNAFTWQHQIPCLSDTLGPTSSRSFIKQHLQQPHPRQDLAHGVNWHLQRCHRFDKLILRESLTFNLAMPEKIGFGNYLFQFPITKDEVNKHCLKIIISIIDGTRTGARSFFHNCQTILSVGVS